MGKIVEMTLGSNISVTEVENVMCSSLILILLCYSYFCGVESV